MPSDFSISKITRTWAVFGGAASGGLRVRLIESTRSLRILALVEEQEVFAAWQLEQLGLTLDGRGKTNSEIVAILGARARTLQDHTEHTFQKLQVENRASAILRVLELRRE